MSWNLPPIVVDKRQKRKESLYNTNNQEDSHDTKNRVIKLEEENSILKEEIRRSAEERRSLHQAVRALSSLVERDAKEMTTLKGGLNLQRQETKTLTSLIRDTLKNEASLEELGDIRSRFQSSEAARVKKFEALENRHNIVMSEIQSLRKSQEQFQQQFSNFTSRTVNAMTETETRTRRVFSNAETLHQSIMDTTSNVNEMKENLKRVEAETRYLREDRENVHRRLASYREEMMMLLKQQPPPEATTSTNLKDSSNNNTHEILTRVSDLANRVASNENNTNQALSEHRNLILQKMNEIVRRNEARSKQDDISTQQSREIQRTLVMKIRDLEKDLALERQRNEENIIRLGRELEQRTRSWGSKLEKGSDRERSVEEILRIEIQERMNETKDLRDRVSSLVSDMSKAIERVSEQNALSESEIRDSIEHQRSRVKETTDAIRQSCSETVLQLSNRIEEQHRAVGVGLEEMRRQVDGIGMRLVQREEQEQESLENSNNSSTKRIRTVTTKQRRMSKPPNDEEWERVEDEENGVYYFNTRTGQSQWQDPRVTTNAVIIQSSDENRKGATTSTTTTTKSSDVVDLEPIQIEIDEMRRDLEHFREETDVHFVESRQERNMIRKSQRVMGNQHDSSMSLFQSTLMTHAAYVGEMEERRTISDVMDKMITQVEAEALRSDVQNTIISGLRHHENNVRDILRSGEKKMEMQRKTMVLCSEDRDNIMRTIEDAASKLRIDLEALRKEHQVVNEKVCERTSRLEKDLTRQVTRLDENIVRNTIESKLVSPVIRSTEMKKQESRILTSCHQTCLEEINTRIERVRSKILEEVATLEKDKEKRWHDELIHAQAFLDGLPLPLPPSEDSCDDGGEVGPRVAVDNIFPEMSE